MKRLLVTALVAGLLVPQGAWAQNGLKIYILQGEGAVNNITTKLATAPMVEVRDSNDFPVAGAAVTFELPATGPSATFEGGKLMASNTSDSRGQVGSGLMTPNAIEGLFAIKVTAKLGDRTGMTTLRQTNSTKAFSAAGAKEKDGRSFWSRNKWWLMGIGLGAAVGVSVYYATRDTSSAAVLQPGTIVIGGPR